MAKYEVAVPFSGYVRGSKVYEVVADSPGEAISKARDFEWYKEHVYVVRDDTTTDWRDADVEEMVQ